MLKRGVFIIGLAAVAFAGCKRLPSPPVVPPQATSVPVVAGSPQATIQPEGNNQLPAALRTPTPKSDVRLKASSSYQPFTLAAYNAAKAAGRPILLYFYANWCPLCRPQEPVNVDLFGDPGILPLGIAGFRVNYNDDETDDDERALARQLGVNYQHTFITVARDGKEKWRTTGTQNREQLVSQLQTIR